MDEQIKNILYNYFSGRITEAEEARLLAWLEEGEEHKQLFSDMSDWWGAVHVPVFMSGMENDFEQHFGLLRSRSVSVRRRKLMSAFLKVAASLLLLISVSLFSFYMGKTAGEPEENIRSYETHVPYGSRSQITLPDESVVWINAGSTFIYRENPVNHAREVTLEGEAYFEIKTDSLNPLIINSEKLHVRVLGTSFNIKAYKEEDLIDITLVTGKLNVMLDEPGETVELSPNDMLSYNKKEDQYVISYVDPKDIFAWKDGIFKFKNQSFAQIAKSLERKYNIYIQIESELLKNEFFTGSFSAQYSLEQILQEIDMDSKYVWKRIDSEVIIGDR